MKRIVVFSLTAVFAVANSACLFHHKQMANPLANVHSQQPDKELFDKAMKAINKDQFTVARLSLQTLINTYPDSQYLARAKMAIGDSWYKEGGADGLAQAEAEYKDFITFFPNMKEAGEAQFKIARIHFDELQKPDRDPTQAEAAERELRDYLVNYPYGAYSGQAMQMLREVQEVLAERQFRIGEFYLLRQNYRAAQNRLLHTVTNYPLYSKGDIAMADLARSFYESSGYYFQASDKAKNPTIKKLLIQNGNADRTQAVHFYSKLIRRYPLSPEVHQAVARLSALHAPIPRPTPQEIAFNRQEIASRRQLTRLQRLLSTFEGAPKAQLATADRVGKPTVTAPTITNVNGAYENISAAPATSSASNSGQVQLESVSSSGLNDSQNGTIATATQNSQSQVLTPDQIDKQKKQRILEEQIHENVPVTQKKENIFERVLP